MYGTSGSGIGWKTIAIIVGIVILGACAWVALGVILPALGYGS
jgi:hypothetical protein